MGMIESIDNESSINPQTKWVDNRVAMPIIRKNVVFVE